MAPPFCPLFIDGQQKPSSTNATFEVRNPFSNKVVTISASASSQDCKDAAEAAGKAFKTWEFTSLTEKRNIFLRAADLLASEEYRQKVNDAEVEETASTALYEVASCAASIEYLRDVAGAIVQLRGETKISDQIPGGQILVHRRALGVVFTIAPWNAPFLLSLRAIAYPIICGNTVVLKSSEYSPRSQSLVADLFKEAGLPNGVLNFISMSRETSPALVAEIIAHPLVRKITFTGSDRVGRIIAQEAAKYLKQCVFELGGKAPAIVLDDANIADAAKAIVSGALLHSGQICMSTERVIVQKGAADALTAAIKDLCSNISAGDPSADKKSLLSALFTEGSAENVLKLVKSAQADGAEIILGDLTRDKTVVQPHVIKGVKPGMQLWGTESFGPVIALTVADTIDEAVDLANDSDYTLTSALWTTNPHTAMTVALRIRAGHVNVNGSTIPPFGEALADIAGIGGGSGYGRFDVENFTDRRSQVIYPPGGVYPLVDFNL